MWVCLVCVTVHVLFVWLVPGVAGNPMRKDHRADVGRRWTAHGGAKTNGDQRRSDGLSLIGKDVTRSHPTLHTHWRNVNLTTDPLSLVAGTVQSLIPLYSCYPSPGQIDKDFTPCVEGYCRCNDDVADCSGHYGKLTYVPAFPRGVSIFNFADNDLRAITHDNFFRNVTNIAVLNLNFNNMSYVSPGALRSMVNLRGLWLRGNNLSYKALAPVLSVTTLALLDLSFNLPGAPPGRLFDTYPLPYLNTLCMIDLSIIHLNMAVFTPLPRLKSLDLSMNYLSCVTLIPGFLPHLERLKLTVNSFKQFPKSCKEFGSFMPNLNFLDLSFNNIVTLPSASVCLPRLESFTCYSCTIATFPTNAFGEHLFPSLKYFYYKSKNVVKAVMEKYVFNNTKLNLIHLFESELDFSTDSIHPDCFAGCSNLQELALSGNDFSRVSVQKGARLFNHPNLSTLWLSSADISHVSAELFTNLPNLAYLFLNSNKLTDIPDGVFDSLVHLEWLDLSSNRISVFREITFSPATRQRLRRVDIGDNPFHCDCELRWFRHWLTTQPGLLNFCDKRVHPCTNYTCDNLVNTTVQSFYVADQACLWNPAVSKFIIATIILLMLPLTAGTVIYRYRWHIRLVWYEAVRGRGDRWRRLQEQDFRYDVFVCYDSEDLDWVRAHLMPELEGRLGLKLCIHSRDFTLGAPIVENIEESVETSKKIMMLFSKDFADSHWCQFELQLCLIHVLEHGDALLVVLLEDIPSRDLTPAMMAVMKTVTYIEWGDEPEARASFWGRIRMALHEILA